jgi:hypothetical protein
VLRRLRPPRGRRSRRLISAAREAASPGRVPPGQVHRVPARQVASRPRVTRASKTSSSRPPRLSHRLRAADSQRRQARQDRRPARCSRVRAAPAPVVPPVQAHPVRGRSVLVVLVLARGQATTRSARPRPAWGRPRRRVPARPAVLDKAKGRAAASPDAARDPVRVTQVQVRASTARVLLAARGQPAVVLAAQAAQVVAGQARPIRPVQAARVPVVLVLAR